MNSYFFDSEIKANRLILNINWALIIIGTAANLIITKGTNVESFKKVFISLLLAAGLALIAEIWYFFGIRNIISGKILKYYIIAVVAVTAYLMMLGVGEAFALGIYFYPLITSALYHNRKVVVFSTVLNVIYITILISNNLINISTPQYRVEFFGEILGTFILCIFMLAGHVKQSATIVKTFEKQEEELADTHVKLQVANNKLRSEQGHLQFMNETLAYSNEALEKALKELEQTQKELIQHEKIASLGQLSAGVAHEINTPIGAIKSNIDVCKHLIHGLKRELIETPSEEAESFVQKLESVTEMNVQACTRIEKTVKSLKNFARGDIDERQQFDITAIIENVLVLLNSKITEKVSIIKEYGEIPKIECYPGQLNQAILNLIQNAIEAVKGSGNILIKTGSFGIDRIYVKIKDNGSGISKKDLENLFDPWFTTKGDRIGTGLSLANVYRIIESHNGMIEVDSEEEKGSEFTIILPVANK
jgi:hypothetical protein